MTSYGSANGSTTSRLHHMISDEQAVEPATSSTATLTTSDHQLSQRCNVPSVALPSSFGTTVLTHIPAVVVASSSVLQAPAGASDAAIISAQKPSTSSLVLASDSTKFNSNSNNVLSHPPPLIRHAESSEEFQQCQDLEQSSLEKTVYTRLCHPRPPPQLIPISTSCSQLKAESEGTRTIWHAARLQPTVIPTVINAPWPVPPNSSEGAGFHQPSSPSSDQQVSNSGKYCMHII